MERRTQEHAYQTICVYSVLSDGGVTVQRRDFEDHFLLLPEITFVEHTNCENIRVLEDADIFFDNKSKNGYNKIKEK